MDIADFFEFDQPTWIWAGHYRAHGLQVIPCQGKMPLGPWKEFQNELVSDATFAAWCAEGGRLRTNNIGVVLGKASGARFMLDLDTYKGPEALNWWNGCLAVHNNSMDLETWEQITGGGGRQLFFQCPEGRSIGNGSTALNVDVRGQAGFAVLPPSLHASGRRYRWLEGRAPGQVDLLTAPQWLMDELEALLGAHGKPAAPAEATATPEQAYDAFGNVQDGREKLMRDIVYRAVLELYRKAPVLPPLLEQSAALSDAYRDYENRVTSRLPGDKPAGLEREGRGMTAMEGKWKATVRHWGSPKMVADAAKPNPKSEQPHDWSADFASASTQGEQQAKADPTKQFELLDVAAIKGAPDPSWVVEKIIVEQSLGFIFGPPGSLKTFIGLDIALSITTKQPSWWGYTLRKPGAVIYICAEGQASLKYRIAAWESNRNANADGAPFFLIKQSINFMSGDDIGRLLATLETAVARAGGPIAAVFVDTVSKVLPGSDENLQKDMTIFVNACAQVRERYGCVVVGIHHTNKQGGFRGSTVIPAAADFIIETRYEVGASTGSVFVEKVKDGEAGWARAFDVKHIDLAMGRGSLAIDGTDTEPPSDIPNLDVGRKILNAIDQEWKSGTPFCRSANSSRAAVRNIVLRFSLKAKNVERLLDLWLANKVIVEDIRDKENHIKGYKKIADL
jgi:hypothetical protein